MIEIDGSVKSGSGTILRYSLSLASILKKVLHMKNIRAKRKKPGLQPQHLKAVQACCEITGGSAKNAVPGATELVFTPGNEIKGGDFSWDIGTAGSTTLTALCTLPLGLFADKDSTYTISGGLFQDFAPNAFHMKHVLLKLLACFSVEADMEIVKPGYVPRGAGIIRVRVKPIRQQLKALELPEQGNVTAIKGFAISSHLRAQKVSQRMANTCQKILAKAGCDAVRIETIDDEAAIQRGAALFVYARTDNGCIIGSDLAGKPGRTSEEIGKRVAQNLIEDIKTGATVDRFTADQLILYAALAAGKSQYIIPSMSSHIDSNLWLVQTILGAKVNLNGKNLEIEGIGLGKN